MKNIALLFLMFLPLIVLPASAKAEIEGRYTCSGTDPDGAKYNGRVTIKKTGESYSITWVIDGDTHIGTGILMDNVFSATWGVEETAGLTVYKVQENGTLAGKWLGLGEQKLNTETLTPIK